MAHSSVVALRQELPGVLAVALDVPGRIPQYLLYGLLAAHLPGEGSPGLVLARAVTGSAAGDNVAGLVVSALLSLGPKVVDCDGIEFGAR